MTIKEKLMQDYLILAYKLGKFPTQKETQTFGISVGSIKYHYGKLSNLQKIVIEKNPHLNYLSTPAKLYATEVESFRFNLEKTIIKKENKLLLQDVNTLEYIASFSEKVFSGKIESLAPKPSKQVLPKTHTLVLSDLHIGADLKADETGSDEFGRLEESRRLAQIIKSAVQYKQDTRKQTHLEVLLLGDIIENQLHDPRTGAVLSEQACRAIHLLGQAIGYLSNHYPSLSVRCSPGNHGRLTSRHPGRAIHQKFDSLETIIYYALKAACSKIKNCNFFIPKTPLSSYEVYGKKIGITHGDTVFRPGNPGSGINVKALEQQVNRLNAALPDRQEYSAIIYGHTHTPHLVHLLNGCMIVGNGSLPPPDHYAVSMGIMETANGQWIIESTPQDVISDMKLLKSGKQYDLDESLDQVIKPWISYED